MSQEPPLDPNQPGPDASSSEPSPARSTPPSRRSPVRRRTNQAPASASVPTGRRPFLIVQTVQVLRSTIRSLETVVNRLETDPELATTPPQGMWQQVLAVIRAFLPRVLSRRVSDSLLTGAIASLAALLVIAIVLPNWLPDQPVPPAVATLPSPEAAPAPSATPAIEVTPTSEPAVEPTPSSEPAIEPTPTAEETPSASPEPSPVVQEPEPLPSETPTPEVEAPIAETPSPTVEPEPPPPLTPEQQLLALIQTEITTLSDPYQNGLIQTVQPNYRRSRLVIQLTNQWHELPQSQQRELANKLLKQSQELNFSKLELTDLAGKLLARSPVVGTEMVILQRSQANQTTA